MKDCVQVVIKVLSNLCFSEPGVQQIMPQLWCTVIQWGLHFPQETIGNNGPRDKDFQNDKASARKGNFPVHMGAFVLLPSKADAIFKRALLGPVFFS